MIKPTKEPMATPTHIRQCWRNRKTGEGGCGPWLDYETHLNRLAKDTAERNGETLQVPVFITCFGEPSVHISDTSHGLVWWNDMGVEVDD